MPSACVERLQQCHMLDSIAFLARAYHSLELHKVCSNVHRNLEAHRLVLDFQMGCVCGTPERQCSLLLQGKQQET